MKATLTTPTILDDEKAFILADKLAKTFILHRWWEYEDTAKELLYRDALIIWQGHEYKKISLIVFGFFFESRLQANSRIIH